jgi:hypothetical protein
MTFDLERARPATLAGLAIVLALLMPTEVLAQSRTFYGADGRPSRQPSHRADDMKQGTEPVPDAIAAATEKQRTADEQEIIKTLERLKGRKLTDQEINLSLEQARALGEL